MIKALRNFRSLSLYLVSCVKNETLENKFSQPPTNSKPLSIDFLTQLVVEVRIDFYYENNKYLMFPLGGTIGITQRYVQGINYSNCFFGVWRNLKNDFQIVEKFSRKNVSVF